MSVRGQPSFKTDSYNITHTGMEKVNALFEQEEIIL
jgi:hypothetical protein